MFRLKHSVIRTITHYDTLDGRLAAENRRCKITEEEFTKVSMSRLFPDGQQKELKTRVSNKDATVGILEQLGYFPIAEVKAERISFEFNDIDVDIDIFPHIPPFLEIDAPDDMVANVLSSLALEHLEQFIGGTPEIYSRYGLEYFVENKY